MAPPDPADPTLSLADRRELIAWAADCATRLLPTFAQACPADARLVDALAAVPLFRSDDAGVAEMRRLAFTCHDAARDAPTPEATAVARACGQAIAVAHMGGHARNVARYTRKALHGDALQDELAWQRDHLPPRFRAYVFQTPSPSPGDPT